MLRVGVCQLNLTVGDLDGNAERMIAALGEVSGAGADVAVFPELAVCGYPPEDLLAKPRFARDCRAALEKVAAATGRCAAVVGLPLADDDGDGAGKLFNAAAVCADGSIAGLARKAHLPNYGVFDEKRHFTAGVPEALFEFAGVAVGISICEDIWIDGGAVDRLAAGGAEVIINLNASPYCIGKFDERLAVLRRRIAGIGLPVVYVNLVGGQDELVFDGRSVVLDASGEITAAAGAFVEQILIADVHPVRSDVAREPAADTADETRAESLPARRPRPSEESGEADTAALARIRVSGPRLGAVAAARPTAAASLAEPATLPEVATLAEPLHPLDEVYAALVLGTRDYVGKNGFSDVCVGLSGGIDSSLVATVAADALGAGHVHGVLMPSRYSSDHSVADAEQLCANLGIAGRTIPIEAAHSAVEGMLAGAFDGLPPGLAEENVQSRLRAVVLMALANKFGRLVLTTGNKTETAVGYSTLYGDTAGAFAVIADIWKLQVYELARRRNEVAGRPLIPERVLTKAPSAELRPDQADTDSLPPYEQLDPVARAFVEDDRTAGELIAAGADAELVRRVGRLVDAAEYKRRQAPPGVRVTAKAFGKDRRMPITNRYRGEPQD